MGIRHGCKKFTGDDDHKSEVKRPAMRQKLLDPMEVMQPVSQ